MNKRILLFLIGAAFASQAALALDATAWKHEQSFSISAPGITRLELSPETLNASRPHLEDVRLLTPSGAEFPFIIERASLTPPRSAAVREFKSSIVDGSTVIEMETGSTDAIEAVNLESPAASFIKAARVETSTNGTQWNEIAKNEVVFRQANGASRLRIPFSSASCIRLRITLDDKRSQPVPFTAARVEFASQKPDTVPQGIVISNTNEKPRVTVLTLDLGAANLQLANLRLAVSDPVFSRRVTVSYTRDDNGSARSVTISSAVIYRVTTNDGLSTESLDVPVHQQVPDAKLTLTIENGDSPPLHVSGVEATRQPVALIFFAQETGAWRLITGNSTASAPSYDLGALDKQMRLGSAAKAQAGALVANPAYKEQAALPGVQAEGAKIDLAKWRYRKPITLQQTGVMRLELDAETLSHARWAYLDDLRVIQNEKQIPFLIDQTNAFGNIQPVVVKENDPKRRTVSVWKATMPLDGLPTIQLTMSSPTALFDRTLTVWSRAKDHMGNEIRMQFGSVHWTKQGGDKDGYLSLFPNVCYLPKVFFIETDNGDNPPIEISDVKVSYGVSAVVAKITGSAPVFLYYGNDEASAPRYDLQLVRAELLAAQKQNAVPGKEEVLRASKKASGEASTGSPWLWAALALVIGALLWVVAKMLPKTDEAA